MEAFYQWESGEAVGKIEVKEIGKSRIEIYSQVLLEVIRSVVSYYPGQNLAGDVVTIHQQYPVLIYHRHELRALQATEEPLEAVRSKHIRLLFEFLDPFIDRVIVPEERRYKKSVPAATFDNLWLLLKSGTFVYETYKEKPMCKDGNVAGENPSAAPGPIPQWDSFDNITPNQFENLTEDHYVLASPVMAAFGLKDKTWGVFEVECFQEIQGQELQKPVLPQGDIEVIEALAYRQENMQKAWRPDFIQDKDEGQITLLHGPPGVGKTYTVDKADFLGRQPLLSLAIADIGTEEHSIEGELMKWFYFAETWNAILLIDEADIFLERKSNYYLARNGIVSVFLRQMEYFRGICFLTKNRVEHIDDAFLSRVHVVLEYKSLDGEMSNRIWEAFFVKLLHDMKGKFIIHSQAKRFILDRKEGSEVQWSGREIRNTLQTAVALAEYEASKEGAYSDENPVIVVTEHFKQVMQMSRAFCNHMTSVHAGTELKRAQLNRDRNDSFHDRS
ncbi:P-loop containing nucleoside triphosphate hydrolase protein [Aspergillus affinis]|uniref:P-loop containing nucleoside triphosphate hydrolase protein n=1 Tax=Aspergillus affinis TaxID=1070780 RepID=UPI0022FEA4B9|nr:P-loop containing nucleoside triphosphate hydrolase protein [Aspergillus affinis]KAI9038958.1 P-loop containing nucleoside triphosphate hydrolase protein [Aspergillus affinis]